MRKIALLLFVTSMIVHASCNNDDMEPAPKENFTLTIENVFNPSNFFATGTTEGIAPGGSYSFTLNAGPGHHLSLATMLAQSNDLFYGFQDSGIALYDASGAPTEGNVTDMIYLWDGGTELNEEPGQGANQAPRQPAPDTGMDENGLVRKITDVDDGFMYPPVSAVIQVMIAHNGGTEFTVAISNKSDMASLSSPLAPGVWVVHSANAHLFTENQAASDGLERLAEDGNNEVQSDFLMMNTGLVSPFAPGVFAVFSNMNPVFSEGMTAPDALRALAEDGDPSSFDLETDPAVSEWGIFLMPASGNGAAPIFPGDKYEVSFKASPGDLLTFATMLVQSNDLFVAPEGINLFSNGLPNSGDITNQLKLWDAKTEVNEYPGAGINQAPRQAGPETGADETGTIAVVNDGFTYPEVSDMIRVSISNN